MGIVGSLVVIALFVGYSLGNLFIGATKQSSVEFTIALLVFYLPISL
jgi:hypothetical protein